MRRFLGRICWSLDQLVLGFVTPKERSGTFVGAHPFHSPSIRPGPFEEAKCSVHSDWGSQYLGYKWHLVNTMKKRTECVQSNACDALVDRWMPLMLVGESQDCSGTIFVCTAIRLSG